jgi:hypothetical protein
MTQETVNYYTDELNRFKTASSKKAFLTRSKKEVQDYIDDLNWALDGRGWLHGERVYQDHVWNQEDELRLIEKLYNKLTK